MNTDSLRYFYFIAEGSTYLEVAEENNISQSSLSKAIQRLEEELGVKLFDRRFRSAKLTPAGQCLHSHLTKLAPRYYKMLMDIQSYSETLHISCCAVPSFTVLGLTNLLMVFTKENHNILIEQHKEKDSRTAIEQLIKGKFDFVVMHKAFYDEKHCDFTYLCNDYLHVVLPLNHPFASMESISLDDLKDKTVLLDTYMNNTIRDVSSITEFKFNIELTDLTREDVITCIASGHGISLYYASDINAFKLDKVAVRRIKDFPHQPLVLASAKKRKITKTHILLKEYLISKLSKVKL
jgi:DNA-binding transcriptional LysR family regulator